MGLSPAVFWRMSLAEWRTMVEGYNQRVEAKRGDDAWVLSHTLIAAGCDADKVTPAKLLGLKEKKPRGPLKVKAELTIQEMFAKMPRCDAQGKLIGKVIDGE